jgi:hypothetical protein
MRALIRELSYVPPFKSVDWTRRLLHPTMLAVPYTRPIYQAEMWDREPVEGDDDTARQWTVMAGGREFRDDKYRTGCRLHFIFCIVTRSVHVVLVLVYYLHNTMEFSVGAIVQAVDSLGRWESGRIVDIREEDDDQDEVAEDGEALICFTGWDNGYNDWISVKDIRETVDPHTTDLSKYVCVCYTLVACA